MRELQCYDPIGEVILRQQYVNQQSIGKVMIEVLEELREVELDPVKRDQLDIAEATYHRWE